ncbi:hypothetical protein [Legionella sp. MW5194]|uniref:hypothetical protein n=1 Tax=Legionella sp. MW5194 TaxID=2662448 RepID=UPI00193E30D7|nr:hypothetical protein [Legionella sp. MW5194]
MSFTRMGMSLMVVVFHGLPYLLSVSMLWLDLPMQRMGLMPSTAMTTMPTRAVSSIAAIDLLGAMLHCSIAGTQKEWSSD